MTKVDITLNLSRALTDGDLKNISRLHSIYGMFVVRVLPSGDKLFIEYDAARMSPKEVRGTLEEHGIPVA